MRKGECELGMVLGVLTSANKVHMTIQYASSVARSGDTVARRSRGVPLPGKALSAVICHVVPLTISCANRYRDAAPHPSASPTPCIISKA